jgi:putative transcriptional regulator
MLSDNIKTIRKNRGFTQEDLAARLHVTRQTISKWEKGYSVPDADLLPRMAEVFEVPVTELLGAPSQPASDPDPVVEQLARLNEQLVIRNRRASRIWKIVGITLAAIAVIWLVLAALGAANYTAGPGSAAGTVEWSCILDGETGTCGVSFDKNYRILTCSTDDAVPVDIMNYSDARDVQDALAAWAADSGGTVTVIRQTGQTLPAAAP